LALAKIVWNPVVGCRLRSMEYPVSRLLVSGHDRATWLFELAVAVRVVGASAETAVAAIAPLGARQAVGPSRLQSLASCLRH
jgi:hypothetical protein